MADTTQTKRFSLGTDLYDIPTDKIEAFRKRYPDAVEAAVSDSSGVSSVTPQDTTSFSSHLTNFIDAANDIGNFEGSSHEAKAAAAGIKALAEPLLDLTHSISSHPDNLRANLYTVARYAPEQLLSLPVAVLNGVANSEIPVASEGAKVANWGFEKMGEGWHFIWQNGIIPVTEGIGEVLDEKLGLKQDKVALGELEKTGELLTFLRVMERGARGFKRGVAESQSPTQDITTASGTVTVPRQVPSGIKGIRDALVGGIKGAAAEQFEPQGDKFYVGALARKFLPDEFITKRGMYALSPSPTGLRGRGKLAAEEQLVKTAVETDIFPDTKGNQDVAKAIASVDGALNTAVTKANIFGNAMVDLKAGYRALEDKINTSKWDIKEETQRDIIGQVKREMDIKIARWKDGKMLTDEQLKAGERGNGIVPITEANTIKSTLWNAVDEKFDKNAGYRRELYKAVAHQYVDEMARYDPNIKALGKADSDLLSLDDEIAKQFDRLSKSRSIPYGYLLRRVIYGTIGYLAGAGEWSKAAGLAGGEALGELVLNSRGVAARLAVIANKLRKIGLEPKSPQDLINHIRDNELPPAGTQPQLPPSRTPTQPTPELGPQYPPRGEGGGIMQPEEGSQPMPPTPAARGTGGKFIKTETKIPEKKSELGSVGDLEQRLAQGGNPYAQFPPAAPNRSMRMSTNVSGYTDTGYISGKEGEGIIKDVPSHLPIAESIKPVLSFFKERYPNLMGLVHGVYVTDPLAWGKNERGYGGWYNAKDNVVYINQNVESETKLANILAHELTHALYYNKRLLNTIYDYNESTELAKRGFQYSELPNEYREYRAGHTGETAYSNRLYTSAKSAQIKMDQISKELGGKVFVGGRNLEWLYRDKNGITKKVPFKYIDDLDAASGTISRAENEEYHKEFENEMKQIRGESE